MNTDLSVPDLVSRKKGYFVFCFILLDFIFAIVQLLPFMSLPYFIFLYVIPYFIVFFLYCYVSMKNPGYQAKQSGEKILEILTKEYKNKNLTTYSHSKIKELAAKYCYHCNISKSKKTFNY